jgi:hypothetical protein
MSVKGWIGVALAAAGLFFLAQRFDLMAFIDGLDGDPSRVNVAVDEVEVDGSIVTVTVLITPLAPIEKGVQVECSLLHPAGGVEKTKKERWMGQLTFGQMQRITVEMRTSHHPTPAGRDRINVDGWSGPGTFACACVRAR